MKQLSVNLHLPTVDELVNAKCNLIRRRMAAQGKVRLSKHILKEAHVIAQVDQKFILLKADGVLIAVD